jgi:NADH dehydrogenase
MRVSGRADVWALGDCAAVPNAATGAIAAPIAQVAVQQGRQLAANIGAVVAGRPARPFSYKPVGMMAAIGRRNAVGEVLGVRISGFIAWFIWRGIYLFKMPTLARRVQIAFDWAWELIFPRDLVQFSTTRTERLSRAHFEKGRYVFRKGEPAEKFFLIEHGSAGVYPDESAPAAAVLGPGGHFGERALLAGTPHSASVKAEEPLDVLTLGRESFTALLSRMDSVRGAMQASVRRIKASDEFIRLARDYPELQRLTAGDVMKGPPATLPVGLRLFEALEQAKAGGRGAYPVVDAEGRMVGLLTRTDFYRAVRDLKPSRTPLREVMTAPVITVAENAPAPEVVLKFLREPVKRLVVVKADDPGIPVGMVTPFDILSAIRDADFLPPGRSQEIAATDVPLRKG